MDEMKFQFRTAAFGGFQKQDVLAYLEESAREQAEKLADLQRQLDAERADKSETEEDFYTLEKRVRTLVEENQRLAADLAQREAALAQVTAERDALTAEAAQLGEQVKRLTPAAAAYEGVKDRTAGIELEAHGRAQAIEREAQERVKRDQEKAEEWFGKIETSYQRLRTDLDATLAHAVSEMERVEQSLQGITREFSSHDEALKSIRGQIEALSGPKPPMPLPLEEEEP